MSTRSLVALQVGDHFESIYVHFDGYLKGVGQSLLNTQPMNELLIYWREVIGLRLTETPAMVIVMC